MKTSFKLKVDYFYHIKYQSILSGLIMIGKMMAGSIFGPIHPKIGGQCDKEFAIELIRSCAGLGIGDFAQIVDYLLAEKSPIDESCISDSVSNDNDEPRDKS